MPTCKKCNQEIPYGAAHAKGCGSVVTSELPVAESPKEDKLDKITNLIGAVIDKQNKLESRLDHIENPTIKNIPHEKPAEVVVKNLESTLQIAKEVTSTGTNENPVCKFGIHFPSDFGQKPQFDLFGKPREGTLSPATRRCFEAPPEIKKIVNDILTPEFGVDILPDPSTATFMLNIIVPAKYCVVDEYRFGQVKDVRSKSINNFNATAEVRAYCLKVREKISKEHLSAQLSSPFTVPSMRDALSAPVLAGANTGASYSVKQVNS